MGSGIVSISTGHPSGMLPADARGAGILLLSRSNVERFLALDVCIAFFSFNA